MWMTKRADVREMVVEVGALHAAGDAALLSGRVRDAQQVELVDLGRNARQQLERGQLDAREPAGAQLVRVGVGSLEHVVQPRGRLRFLWNRGCDAGEMLHHELIKPVALVAVRVVGDAPGVLGIHDPGLSAQAVFRITRFGRCAAARVLTASPHGRRCPFSHGGGR